MKTIKEFRYIDPDNKLNIIVLPAGAEIKAESPYYERLKESGYLEESAPKKKRATKKKMTDPDAE